ncbi:Flp pilus assembly protein TadG [Novosphingobium hassiacum]|uniref:Flp pilus assembly protein TadG n=1 Tax=Novosphingobium hassiacum TaxID=173676 RepID=A0A7W6EWP3_9SPHN|nr:TadE family protein [Novosphingobium hassiacum]MBB3861483.1 Flp pilus assembly protein TadG [Novosphingobium hassiacum]
MSLRALRGDSSGATIVEFAIVMPMFLVLLLGILDIGQMAYGKSVLSGAVRRAARASALETRSTAQADAMVLDMVKEVLPGATLSTSRTSYYDFSDIGRAEKWNDRNGNGRCDASETFTDENRNGVWDEEMGRSNSEGSANDVVVYKVVASFEPVFKVPFLPGAWGRRTLTATAVTKNQPFGAQPGYGSSAGACA